MPLTFEREDSLPTLPVPDLQQSLLKALAATKPLISENDYNNLIDEAQNFVNSSISQTLQSHLIELSKKNINYLNSPGIFSTNSNIYGDLRGQTLPRNPFFILEDDPMKNFSPTQEYRAAVLITSTLRFIVALKNGILKSDSNPSTNDPYTMSSYHNLFGTCVIPQDNGIQMKKFKNSKHVVFLSNGQFFSLTVLSEIDQIWFSKHELCAIIKKIIEVSKNETDNSNNINISTFTSESKSTWKMARLSLEKLNPKQMEIIDSALFIISIDNESININNNQEKIQFVSHGTSKIDKNGNQYGTCINRYYDKLNLVVTKNATAACIYPASIIDGTTVLRYISDVYTDSVLRLARMINGKNYTLWNEINTVPINSEIIKPDFTHIKFNYNNEIVNGLNLAESRLADIINQHEYVSKKILLGKNYIKNKMQLPCDSFIQLCIQITYYALYGKCPSTFEPVSTRKFRDARTEPICIQNENILKLCQSFISQTTDSEKWKLLLTSINSHKQLAIDASNGLGFERHLSSLRSAFIQSKILNEINDNLPKIETNLIPKFLFNPILDSIYKPEIVAANCGNPALDYFGITPSIPSGYGFGYIIKDDYITIVGSSQWRQTSRFLDTLERVIFNIKQIWKNVVVNKDSRDSELQKYVSSIPMSMIQSNNSWLPSALTNNNKQTASTVTTDAYILGGYDYFDVEKLNCRSEMASNAQSRALSRVNSQINLGGKVPSFKNVKSAFHDKPASNVGRLISIQPDL